MKIIFTDTVGISEEYKPQLASKLLPDWYKNTESYKDKIKKPAGDGTTTATIKKCMPVFDVMNAGYFLVTHTDVYVSQRKNDKGETQAWYEWGAFSPLAFHDKFQAVLHPKVDADIPKYFNPWGIKTPKGYSTFFTSPAHHDNVFEALPAIVDTDKYFAPVNIVFTLGNKNFEGLVPAGTPICQVIPFKRDNWKMEIGKEKDIEIAKNVSSLIQSKFFDAYKTMFRQEKQYK